MRLHRVLATTTVTLSITTAVIAVLSLLSGCTPGDSGTDTAEPSASSSADSSTTPAEGDASGSDSTTAPAEWPGAITANNNSKILLGTASGGFIPSAMSMTCSQDGDTLTAKFTSPQGTFTTTRPAAPGAERAVGGEYVGTDGTTVTWALLDGVAPGTDQSEDGPQKVFTGARQWGTPVVWGADGTSIRITGMHATTDAGEVGVRVKEATCGGGVD